MTGSHPAPPAEAGSRPQSARSYSVWLPPVYFLSGRNPGAAVDAGLSGGGAGHPRTGGAQGAAPPVSGSPS